MVWRSMNKQATPKMTAISTPTVTAQKYRRRGMHGMSHRLRGVSMFFCQGGNTLSVSADPGGVEGCSHGWSCARVFVAQQNPWERCGCILCCPGGAEEFWGVW